MTSHNAPTTAPPTASPTTPAVPTAQNAARSASATDATGAAVTKLADVVPHYESALPPALPGAHWDTIAGERVAFLPQRAAWWERARTLILADLHLGKAETFAAAGAALNGGVLDHTLAQLSDLASSLDAARLIIVGDLLHAPAGLTSALIDRVREWRRTLLAQIVVVPGNHDRRIDAVAREWDLLVTSASLIEPPFGFVHDPADVPALSPSVATWWVGHVHPCIWLGNRADALKLPCFIASDRLVQLPAFSTFTSGVCVRPSPGDRVHAIADSTVVSLTR